MWAYQRVLDCLTCRVLFLWTTSTRIQENIVSKRRSNVTTLKLTSNSNLIRLIKSVFASTVKSSLKVHIKQD